MNETDVSENKYYVYVHRRMDTGTVFYVGKGCGSRIDYPYRNEEHDYIVHYLQKNNIELRTEKIAENLTEAEAYNLEARTICRYVADGYGLNKKHWEMPADTPYLANRDFGHPAGKNDPYPAYTGNLGRIDGKIDGRTKGESNKSKKQNGEKELLSVWISGKRKL